MLEDQTIGSIHRNLLDIFQLLYLTATMTQRQRNEDSIIRVDFEMTRTFDGGPFYAAWLWNTEYITIDKLYDILAHRMEIIRN